MTLCRAITVGLLALGPAACSGDAEAGADGPSLAFDWGARGDARVTETRFQDGKRTRSRYRLLFQPDARAGGQVVERLDLQVLELERDPRGEDPAKDPSADPDYAELDVHGLTFPRLVVSGEGQPIDFLDYEDGVDRYAEALRAAGMVESRVGILRAKMLQPAVQQGAQTTILGHWNLWVTGWIGYPVEEGWELTREVAVDTGVPGISLPTRATVRCVEVVEVAGKLCARYERDIVYDEQALTQLLGAQPGFFPRPLPAENLLAAMRLDRAEILIEIDGMRPHSVSSQTTFEVQSVNKEESSVETSSVSFTFEWPTGS